MTKRVFLIHGWGGSPEGDWLPWAKSQLEQQGYRVHTPQMPDTDSPQIDAWISTLIQEVGKPEHTDIFIGHSIGCQAILRYLETLKDEEKVDKVIFVAGWHTLSSESTPTAEDKQIAKPWVETPINFDIVRQKANTFIGIFSDNDYDVPFQENNKWFNDNLGISTVVLKNKGHFTGSDNVTELPELLKFVKLTS